MVKKSIDFDQVAPFYDVYVTSSFDISFWLEEAKRKPGRVLELMAGTGRVSIPLIEAGVDLTCVDYAQELLNILKRKLEERCLSADVLHGDVRNLELGELFDLVFIAFHSFEELVSEHDQVLALRSASNVLSKDGRFVVSLHNPTTTIPRLDGSIRDLGCHLIPGTDRKLSVLGCYRYVSKNQVVEGMQCYVDRDGAGKIVKQIELPIRFRLTDEKTFRAMVQALGFGVEALYGDYDRSSFSEADSPYMIWTLRHVD